MNKKLTDSEIAELRGIGERHAAPDMLRRHELVRDRKDGDLMIPITQLPVQPPAEPKHIPLEV